MEDSNGTHWPTPGDCLFEEVHLLRGAMIAGDLRERFWRLVNGYRYGADHLVDSCIAQPHLGRNLVYPIIYLYRHSFELALKMFLVDFGLEAGESADFQSHRLDRLWTKCKNVIIYYYPHDQGKDEISVIEAIVAEFTTSDENSFSYRYAYGRDGSGVELKEGSINLERLKKTMDGIHTFFDCIGTDLVERSQLPSSIT